MYSYRTVASGTARLADKRLNQHVVQLMNQTDVKERMAAGASDVVTGTPEQLAAKLKSDDTRMRKLFKHIGLSPDK